MTLDVLFPVEFVKALLLIALFIVIDLVFAVALALKQGRFDLKQLADFYRTKVLPCLLGWAVLDVALRIAVFYQIPLMDSLQPVLAIGFYGIVLAALGAQVLEKGLAIAKTDTPPATPSLKE
jgi:hypothetical protein